jgi:type IV pilus assembly protein PilC
VTPIPLCFAYQAQTELGQAVSGTIDAADADQATRLLQALRLRVIQIDPATAPPRPKAITGDDFLAFNQQLTHLTRAGLPVEHGLRLIAQDMRSGRLAETVRQVADDLERGTPLEQAFEKRHQQFPPLYGRLVAAGVKTANLPGMLLNLGRHMEMVYRLRALLWRSLAYPLIVLGALAMIMVFLCVFVIPKFEAIFQDFGIQLPAATVFILNIARLMPTIVLLAVFVVAAAVIIWLALRFTGRHRAAADVVLLPLPLVGPVLKRNLVARWCDAVRLGVAAGLDLPQSIALAGDAIDSPSLRHDSDDLVAAVQSGQRVDMLAGHTRILPATVPTAMSLSIPNQDLAATLGTLSEMYQQQAETRMALLPSLLTPVMLILVAVVIGFVVLSLFLPFITLIQAMT